MSLKSVLSYSGTLVADNVKIIPSTLEELCDNDEKWTKGQLIVKLQLIRRGCS